MLYIVCIDSSNTNTMRRTVVGIKRNTSLFLKQDNLEKSWNDETKRFRRVQIFL